MFKLKDTIYYSPLCIKLPIYILGNSATSSGYNSALINRD